MTAPRDPYDWTASWAWPLIERPDVDIPGSAGLVLLRLAAYGDSAGMARPSTRTLAKCVGRSERSVRVALDKLREVGVIDGDPRPARVTRWRLVTDENERLRLCELRTHPPQSAHPAEPATAYPPSAVVVPATADQLRTNCVPTAYPSRDEGEGEGKELPSSPSSAARDVEREDGEAFKTFAASLPSLRRVA